MRGTFVRTLMELAEQDPRVLLLTGDLGYTVLEPFRERFPERFFNAGVSEQNMVGMATGLAEAGYIPFVYSISTFATLRPYEFIRNGPILHQLPVRIVGVGGGFEYGHNGISHYGLDDIGVLRIQPGISVIAPADFAQLRTAMLETRNQQGPVYYRVGKDDTNQVPGLEGMFELGRAAAIRSGSDVLLLPLGSLAFEAVAAADLLESAGISCSVLIIAGLSPSPSDDLAAAMARHPFTVTIEAHYVTGGLGSLACEVAAENGLSSRVVRCGVRKVPDGITGSQSYMHYYHGLSPECIADTVSSALTGSPVLSGVRR